jgi:hypothetical protein
MTPDIVVDDQATGRVLIVEVKNEIKETDREFFMKQLRQYADRLGKHRVVYYLLADRAEMRLFEDRGTHVEPLVDFDTAKTLRNYMAHEPGVRFSDGFLSGLIQAWLRDISLRWKNENPEGSERITPDLLDLLRKAEIKVA